MRVLLLILMALPLPLWGAPAVVEALGFRWTPPPGWQVKTGEVGAFVRLYAPAGQGPRANIGVKAEEVGDGARLTAEALDEIVTTLAETLDGFHLVARAEARVGGLPARRLSYTARAAGRTFRATQTMVVRGGRLLAFTLVTTPEEHRSYLPVYERLLSRIQWLS
ncbi:MAG TPA: DcrB-related protein [Candidatus Nitrosotenuis sp.]|nr:DcrB-related protein [Candidatus Nitrosotenuis sp.]